jgi:hypothetical protein
MGGVSQYGRSTTVSTVLVEEGDRRVAIREDGRAGILGKLFAVIKLSFP